MSDTLDTLDDVASECRIDQRMVSDLCARPEIIPPFCRGLVKAWAQHLERAWSAWYPDSPPLQWAKALDAVTQVTSQKTYAELGIRLKNFEADSSKAKDLVSAKSPSTSCALAAEVLAAVLPLKIRLPHGCLPSELQLPRIDVLADRLSKVASIPFTHAQEFFVSSMTEASPNQDWMESSRVGGVEPDEPPAKGYEFEVTGSPAMGHFVKLHDALIEERNLLEDIACYRRGTYSLADVMEFIDYAMARMPGFLAGMFTKADLMLEHGFIPSACTAYEDAIAAARSLMPTDLRVPIAPGGANDLYLLGMENLARAYLRRGDSALAMQTVKDLHRLAFHDHDCRARCLPAVIAAASDDNNNAQLQLAIGGEAASRPLTSLLRALIYSGAGRHDDAAESLADAVVRQPNLANALTAGIAEDDRHFPNSDLQLLLERRPEIRERMERALSHPDIKGTLDDVWAKTGRTGCFKRAVLLWPEDEPIPTRVIDMRDGILMLSRLLRNAMR